MITKKRWTAHCRLVWRRYQVETIPTKGGERMQALTNKELNYVSDLLGAEDLLIRNCQQAIQEVQQDDFRTYLRHVITQHQRRHEDLLQVLQQHVAMAQ